jgi:hypothetical protein
MVAASDEIAGSLEKSVGQRPDAVVGVTATVTSASIQDGDLDYKLDVKVDG